jgi:hypothetical protein
MAKTKINNWGVFVENDKLETFEIKLPREIALQVLDFIDNSDSSDIVGGNTEGKITW